MDYFTISYDLIKKISEDMISEDEKSVIFQPQKIVNYHEQFAALTKHLKQIDFYKTSLQSAEKLYATFEGKPLEEKIKGLWFEFLECLNNADGELAIRGSIIKFVPLIDKAIKEVEKKE